MKKALIKSLQEISDFAELKDCDLEDISSRGLVHDHIKLGNTGWVARIPRGNQLGLSSEDYLNLQKEIYSVMAQSGATPEIFGIIKPNSGLPHGALILSLIHI